MADTRVVNGNWHDFAAFQVFGDYVPIRDFHVVVRLVLQAQVHDTVLGMRARSEKPLDPTLGQMCIRAGLWMTERCPCTFVYATTEECLVLVPPDRVATPGATMAAHDALTSLFAARLARLSGWELEVSGALYELPSLAVVRRLFVGALESGRRQTLRRSARRLCAQLRGRGHAIAEGDLASAEAQANMLESHGVKVESLPEWWWTGMAARRSPTGAELLDALPDGDGFGELIVG
ncbi:MAG: hypothetical protein B7733_22190 [Myxococcales bacterium FL481]|nr:MAG: hypothetical protein B7733_22190 [Myxococcales bacterium FL481]